MRQSAKLSAVLLFEPRTDRRKFGRKAIQRFRLYSIIKDELGVFRLLAEFIADHGGDISRASVDATGPNAVMVIRGSASPDNAQKMLADIDALGESVEKVSGVGIEVDPGIAPDRIFYGVRFGFTDKPGSLASVVDVFTRAGLNIRELSSRRAKPADGQEDKKGLYDVDVVFDAPLGFKTDELALQLEITFQKLELDRIWYSNFVRTDDLEDLKYGA